MDRGQRPSQQKGRFSLREFSTTLTLRAMKIRVTVWNEFVHERENAEVRAIYPNGIHEAIAASLRSKADIDVKTSTLDDPGQGLGPSVLEATDVLLYWGHAAHEKITEDSVLRIQTRVLEGMGLVVLHSGHWSKIFKRLMGTTCALRYREAGERERVWNVNPGHPIAEGIGDHIELEESEMYGEPFGIPTPDEQVFISWFQGGEIFRGGNCWTRGSGRIFYFSPGHEAYPIYHNPQVQRVIYNAIRWARPQGRKAEVPLHVPVENAPEKINAKGPILHDASGKLVKN
jgi:trehalose utilization protein